jgi:hypothetical protein
VKIGGREAASRLAAGSWAEQGVTYAGVVVRIRVALLGALVLAGCGTKAVGGLDATSPAAMDATGLDATLADVVRHGTAPTSMARRSSMARSTPMPRQRSMRQPASTMRRPPSMAEQARSPLGRNACAPTRARSVRGKPASRPPRALQSLPALQTTRVLRPPVPAPTCSPAAGLAAPPAAIARRATCARPRTVVNPPRSARSTHSALPVQLASTEPAQVQAREGSGLPAQ